MRIVIDLQGAQTDTRFHGIGRYSVDFSLALAEIAAGDHEVWLLVNTAYPGAARELRARFAPWVPPERVLNFAPPAPLEPDVIDDRPLRRAAELIWAHVLRSIQPDCVVVTSLMYSLGSDVVSCMSDRNAARDVEARTAMIVYDLIPWMRPETYLSDPITLKFYTDKLDGMRAAGLLLAISESSRQEVLDYLDFAPDRVVAISSAAGDQFAPAQLAAQTDRADPRTTFGITRPFVMYSPSGIDPRKNNEGLIEAFAALPPGLRDSHQLVITSRFSPSDHERLRIAARRAGLQPDHLVLTGYVSDADLIALYRTTDLFVYPSIHEGFGLPVLEAMACGAPVIGSDRTSVPEIIGREDAQFDPTSIPAITAALEHALSNPSFRDDLRAHGLAQAQQFSWERTAAHALDAMSTVFAETAAINPRTEGALLRDLVTLLAEDAHLLPRAAQAVADSTRAPAHDPEVFVDVTGVSEFEAGQLPAAQLLTISTKLGMSRFVDPAGRLTDLQPGDVVIVSRPENLADADLRGAYEAVQARGVRIALPLASTDALVEALSLLTTLDAGIFCTNDRLFRAVTRACDGSGIKVHRVGGRDALHATLAALGS